MNGKNMRIINGVVMMAKKVEKLKVCTRCGKELPLSEYYKSQSEL